ncbi:MAG: hypothetical protein SNG35_06285 [Rikenellaceae bacterium]
MKNILEGKWLVHTTSQYSNDEGWSELINEQQHLLTFERAESNNTSLIGKLIDRDDNEDETESTYIYFPHPINQLHINSTKSSILYRYDIYIKEIFEIEQLPNEDGYYLNLLNDSETPSPYLRIKIIKTDL